MKQEQLGLYRASLESAQSELNKKARMRDPIAIEQAPDVLDEVILAGEREFAVGELDRTAKKLRNIESALLRIRDGTYGQCLDCGEEIHPKRLDAVPWTNYCLTCSEAATENSQGTGDGQGVNKSRPAPISPKANGVKNQAPTVSMRKRPDMLSNVRAGMPSARNVFDWIAIRQTK